MSELVLTESPRPGVVRLTLNDPENRNAMSVAMADEFSHVVHTLKNDRLVRAVVITGAGKAFSAGGHLDMLFEKTKISREENVKGMLQFYKAFLSVSELRVPTIAAINGHAMGAGLCLALGCDLRIAVSEAKLGLNFVKLGLHPGMGVTYTLKRIVGVARATELLYTGAILTGTEAQSVGLVNRAAPPEQFHHIVESFVTSVLEGGPESIRQLKETLKHSENRSLNEALEREARCQAENYASQEFLEGVSAAREKRKPSFSMS